MITLRFVEHAGLFNRPGLFNRLYHIAMCGFPYSHIDAKDQDGKYIGARLLGGVRKREPTEDAGTVLMEEIIDIASTDEQADAFYAFLRGEVGKPYDPISILYFWGPFAARNWHDPGAWSCNGLIAKALIVCGIIRDNNKIPYWRVSPSHLYWFASSIAGGGADA